MSNKITFICSKCGCSDQTSRDAIVAWSDQDQQWEVVNVLDNGDCNQCGNSGNNAVIEAPLEDADEQLPESIADDGSIAVQTPPPNFDHDPRFDEGGEFYAEANPTANLQPKDDLKFATLGVAQNIVKRVASGISNTEAYLDLQRVVAMLETVMERTPETPEQERARKIKCLRAQAEYVRDLLDVCAAEALHKIADELEALP